MAIAFDTASNGTYGATAASISWSHTCSGSNRLLIVCVGEDYAINGGNPITGVTYNGVAMTLWKRQLALSSVNYASVWYLVAPATGTNTITVTGSISNTWELAGCSASYTGVDQTTPLTNSTDSTYSGGTTPSVTLTPTNSGSWVGACIGNRGGAKSAGASTTERAEESNSQAAIYDNNLAITPSASTTINMVQTTDSGLAVMGYAIKPFVVPATTSSFFQFF